MRVVGGSLKGRTLKGPATQAVRPTSDRLRESIFNILAHGYDDPIDGSRVIDLFAGTGALGLEALSRGAAFCLFVDDGTEARSLIRANVEAFALGGVTKIFRRDATRLGAMPPQNQFTLAFLDPPYGKGLADRALLALHDGGWLAEGALVLVEEEAKADIVIPEAFKELDVRAYGETKLWILSYGTSHD